MDNFNIKSFQDKRREKTIQINKEIGNILKDYETYTNNLTQKWFLKKNNVLYIKYECTEF